jgi:hypothetical protein
LEKSDEIQCRESFAVPRFHVDESLTNLLPTQLSFEREEAELVQPLTADDGMKQEP